MMTLAEAVERRRLHKIAIHLEYFTFVCLTGSVSGAAKQQGVTPRSVFSHLKWLDHFAGEKLFEDGTPFKTKKLTTFGSELWEDVQADYWEAVKKLDARGMANDVGEKFVPFVNKPFKSRRPKTELP